MWCYLRRMQNSSIRRRTELAAAVRTLEPLLMRASPHMRGKQYPRALELTAMEERGQSDGVTFRTAAASDVTLCNAFHNDFYKTSRTDAAWRWEFDSWAPAVQRGYCIIAEAKGRIVGTQSAIPIPLIAMGSSLASVKSEETLVDKDFRTNRIFARMYDVLNRRLVHDSVAVTWGFTPAGASFQRVGFEVPARTRQIIKSLRADAAESLGGSEAIGIARLKGWAGSVAAMTWGALRSTITPRPPRGLELRILDEAPADADALSEIFSKRWQAITIHRVREYLTWRLSDNPYVKGVMIGAYVEDQLVGYLVYAQPKAKVAFVVDVIVASQTLSDEQTESVVCALLAEAECLAKRGGASAIRTWTVTDHPFDLLVRRATSKRGWFLISHGNDVVIQTHPAYAVALGSFDIDQWYITRLFTEGTLG